MIERPSKLTTSVQFELLQNLLKIPRRAKLIHPCQERTKYSNILQWLTSSMESLKEQNSKEAFRNNPQKLANQQQEIIVSVLTQVIELTKKQCVEKGNILQIVLEYMVSTIKAYWMLFNNLSKQVTYEYEHNAVRLEKDYIVQLQKLQAQNQQLIKDKDHRWRNMFMLIKDNRIHRKQNKKLMKAIEHEMEKNQGLAEQMIKLQLEHEKLKVKINYLEGEALNLENFIENDNRLFELQRKIKQYPKRSKKILKNDLVKIEINQSKNLQDKIKFIIRAIEETGDIIDEIYDDDIGWTSMSFNISTQTDNKTEEKAVNTNTLKYSQAETQTFTREHAVLDSIDTVLVKIMPQKKKQTLNRDSKNVMFSHTTQNFNKTYTHLKKEQSLRSRHVSRKQIRHFSICESLKITIHQNRICYISTYNTQVFNGVELVKEADKKVDAEIKLKKKAYKMTDVYSQTQKVQFVDEPIHTYNNFGSNVKRSFLKVPTNCPNSLYDLDQNDFLTKEEKRDSLQFCEEEVFYCYDPSFKKQKRKFKMSFNSDKSSDSLRSSILIKKSKEKQPIESSKHADWVEKKEAKSEFRLGLKKISKMDEIREAVKNQEEKLSRFKESDFRRESNNFDVNILTPEAWQTPTDDVVLTPNYEHQTSPKMSIKVATEPNTLSELTTPKGDKVFSNNTTATNLDVKAEQRQKSFLKRNNSSIIPQHHLKSLQSNRLSKLTFQRQAAKHKRTNTQNNQFIPQRSSVSTTDNRSSLNPVYPRVKALHRISEDLSQHDNRLISQEVRAHFASKLKPKQKMISMPFSFTKEAQLNTKDIDFSKGMDKMIKSMAARHNQLLHNNYSLKTFLASYFKCLYGKQLYINFIQYLIGASNGESEDITICLNRLINPKVPQGYTADLFKTFVLTVNQFAMLNQNPLAARCRNQVLIYMVGQYMEQERAKQFEENMHNHYKYGFISWFSALEQTVRAQTIDSQLYHFLSQTLIECQDTISVSFIQQLCFFIQDDRQLFKHLIRSKYMLNSSRIPIHRFCLFCFRYEWKDMLDILTSIQQRYEEQVGIFKEEKAIQFINKHQKVLSDKFVGLQKYVNYWSAVNQKYGITINRYLLMLAQLNIVQVLLKNQLPLSLELRYLNLACQGLQKKAFHVQMQLKQRTTKTS